MKGRFICALDIGTVKICALCARQDQAGKIDILANHTRPAAGLRAGRVVNSKKLSTSIKEAVVEIRKACGIKLSRVFVNIDSPDLRARVSEERLSSTLASRYGANKLNRLLQGVAADHVDLDRKVIYAECRRMVAAHRSDDGPRAKVAVLSALIPTIKTYSKSIKDAGLVLEGMVPSGLAQALGLFRNVCNDICAHRLIVDFGGGSTKLTLFEDGLVKAVKLLPIGAQDITDDIAIKLKISSEDAEWLKIRYGFADYRKEASSQKILIGERSARRIVLPGKLYEIIASKSDVLLYKTKRAFLELTSGIKDLNIKEMLVTGGGSVLEGFLERAEKVFDMPVKMGFLYGVNDSQIQARSALYSTGVGLICYGLGQKKGTRRYSRIRLKTFRNLLRKAHNLYYEYF